MTKNTNPSIVARETLRQLVISKVPPTPDNYHKMYEKIAGSPTNQMDPCTMEFLSKLTKELPKNTPEQISFVNNLELAVCKKDLPIFKTALIDLTKSIPSIDTQKKQESSSFEANVTWGRTIAKLIKQLENKHGALTIAKKKDSLNRVLHKFSESPDKLHSKLLALVDSWTTIATAPSQSIEITSTDNQIPTDGPTHNDVVDFSTSSHVTTSPRRTIDDTSYQLKKLLSHILDSIAAMQLNDRTLTDEANSLSKQVLNANNSQEIIHVVTRFEQFVETLKSQRDLNPQLQQGLLRLFNLLMDITGKLLPEDQWIQKEIASLHEILSGQLDLQIIERADSHLEKIAQKQGLISNSISETKTTLKKMVTCLVENIESLTNSTDEYYSSISDYSIKIYQTENIAELNQLLEAILVVTKNVQVHMNNSRKDFITARTEVDSAKNKIQQLEIELQQMEEKALEDHLTGILNRRGLDEAFVRESARTRRLQQPMSLAILDIDNFKQLNDKHGHKAGDDALIYLVETVKETTRPSDVVARFGGEEFVILLPETGGEQAASIITRVQRNLTKRLFMHENKRLLITFSAGVAEYIEEESQENIVERADKALYCAKESGKNRVIIA